MNATRREPQILIDDIDLCPSQLSGMINQCVLQPLALEIIPDLTGRRLSNIHTSPPGQMISAYFVHCPPPLPSPSPVLLSTAPVRRSPDVLPPGEVVVVRGRICSPRIGRPRTFAPTLTTAGVLRSSLEWFETCSLSAATLGNLTTRYQQPGARRDRTRSP